MQAAEKEDSVEQARALPVPSVQMDMRELKGVRPVLRDRLRFSIVLGICLLVHILALVPLPFLASDAEAPAEEIIPVELISEPAPEPAPEPPVEPEPPEAVAPPEEKPAALDEKPATDAARSADQDRESGKSAVSPESAPPESAPPEPPKPVSPEISKPELPEIAPEPAPLLPEALAPVPEALAPEALAPMPEQVPPPLPPQRPVFAPMTPLPSFQFEAPARRMQFPGGNAEPTYLSTLYGLIMKQMQTPQMPKTQRQVPGRIVFGIGRDGRIFQEAIVTSSGVIELDRAALAAVRRASPFPPPPNGGSIQIRFDYGAD